MSHAAVCTSPRTYMWGGRGGGGEEVREAVEAGREGEEEGGGVLAVFTISGEK